MAWLNTRLGQDKEDDSEMRFPSWLMYRLGYPPPPREIDF